MLGQSQWSNVAGAEQQRETGKKAGGTTIEGGQAVCDALVPVRLAGDGEDRGGGDQPLRGRD